MIFSLKDKKTNSDQAKKEDKLLNPDEKCLICGCNTGYKRNTPISERNFYVNGCGQLCMECYYSVYNTEEC